MIVLPLLERVRQGLSTASGIRDEGTMRSKAVYLAVGVLPEGRNDVLGFWTEQTEGASLWLRAGRSV